MLESEPIETVGISGLYKTTKTNFYLLVVAVFYKKNPFK